MEIAIFLLLIMILTLKFLSIGKKYDNELENDMHFK